MSHDSTEEASDRSDLSPELPRVLGLFDSIMIVVGSIIGSGIFLKVSDVARVLNDFGWILVVWVGVGLITLCGSLALAELSSMYPRAGGPYLYLREAYGRPVAFLWGWTEFWVVRTGSLGALACATVINLNKVVPLSFRTQEIVAVAIVLGLSSVHYYSTRQGAWVQNLTAVVKVLFISAIILLPVSLGQADLTNLESDPALTRATPPLWQGIALAMMAVLWPYDGWINIGPVAEEIREPHRNLPLGLGLGMLLVILVYAGANLSYHLTLPMAKIAESETIAADVFEKLFGPTGMKFAALGVMISTFGAVNSNMLTGPRIYLAMARDRLIPQSLCSVHNEYRTPANAILVQAVWTVLLMRFFYATSGEPKGAFDGLTDSVILAGLIFYSLTVGAVYILRWKRPDLARPYLTWGYPFTPALLLIAYAAVVLWNLWGNWKQSMNVLLLIGAGLFFYWIWTIPERRSAIKKLPD
ncbi:MAG: APC family permease [Planctomycetaceae bacterium]